MMTREDIDAFVRGQIDAEWRLNPNHRRSREEVIRAITDRWIEDSNDTWREAVEDDRRASDVS